MALGPQEGAKVEALQGPPWPPYGLMAIGFLLASRSPQNGSALKHFIVKRKVLK